MKSTYHLYFVFEKSLNRTRHRYYVKVQYISYFKTNVLKDKIFSIIAMPSVLKLRISRNIFVVCMCKVKLDKKLPYRTDDLRRQRQSSSILQKTFQWNLQKVGHCPRHQRRFKTGFTAHVLLCEVVPKSMCKELYIIQRGQACRICMYSDIS